MLSLGIKRPGCEVDQSSKFSAKSKNEWSYCFSSHICLLGMVLNQGKESVKKLKVVCGSFSALQPVGRLYPCPNEFLSFISRGATHHIGTRDLC